LPSPPLTLALAWQDIEPFIKWLEEAEEDEADE
jgi:hypothetical protein